MGFANLGERGLAGVRRCGFRRLRLKDHADIHHVERAAYSFVIRPTAAD
jgi:hypothetical protein